MSVRRKDTFSRESADNANKLFPTIPFLGAVSPIYLFVYKNNNNSFHLFTFGRRGGGAAARPPARPAPARPPARPPDIDFKQILISNKRKIHATPRTRSKDLYATSSLAYL
jgi:hypothetical protein